MKVPREDAAVAHVQAQFLLHINIIRGFIRALARDRYLADDILQETFLSVTRKAGSFKEGTNFPAWACTVARFKVMETHRKEGKMPVFLSEAALEALGTHADVPLRDYRADLLATCIEELPPAMARSIELRYMADHKPSVIAEKIKWSVEAVYVALSRARSQLRKCIERKTLEDGETA